MGLERTRTTRVCVGDRNEGCGTHVETNPKAPEGAKRGTCSQTIPINPRPFESICSIQHKCSYVRQGQNNPTAHSRGQNQQD